MGLPNRLEQQVETIVRQHLLKNLPAAYVFHNFELIVETVEVAEMLAEAANLPEEDRKILLLATWFQDIDYASGAENHEKRSADMAKAFLEKEGLNPEALDQIQTLILSTHDEHQPESLLEKLLHDANWAFLGRKRFEKKGRLMRVELEQLLQKKFTQEYWDQFLMDLLINKKFCTTWAQEQFGSRKNKNISLQRQKLLQAKGSPMRSPDEQNYGRAIDTLYRITLRNHSNLSSIADGKANMIISINTLVLSLILTVGTAAFSLEGVSITWQPHLVLPLFTLLLSSLLAIVFAVLSAMPKVDGEEFTMDDVHQNKISLLFFGNFLRLDREAYVRFLRDLKKDQGLVYDDLTRDLYNLGGILRRKYSLLTVAYRIFVGGLVLSVATFLVAYLFGQ